ncbi:hypothetical protein NJI34_44840, partial [Pseudomonas sp. S 311-6]|nr:hypothetical protein [Pseudomonas mosselii]MCO7620033.1 hypothetical protein [Pseudomonas guariconensis]MCO7643880.1 hypothetical protein [Pseudomonas sp. S 311-6]
MVMVIEARFADDRGVANALRMTPAQWMQLQVSYQMGELLMPCCPAPAVPKLSPKETPNKLLIIRKWTAWERRKARFQTLII